MTVGINLGLRIWSDGPEPRALNGREAQRAQELLHVWRDVIGPIPETGSSDFENFFETAARLDAAVTAVGRESIWVETSARDMKVKNFVTGAPVPEGLTIYGPRTVVRENAPEFAPFRLADQYMHFETFAQNAGRRVILCGHDLDGDGVELVDVVQGFAGRRIIVKATRSKHGLWTLDIPAEATSAEVKTLLFEELDWSLIHMEGMRHGYLVQEWVPMFFEYRTFIIDGKPVTGAGCVEELTPLSNRTVFDLAVRRDRHDQGSAYADNPDVVKELVEFASTVAGELLAEQPALRSYVIDVALNSDGMPLVIELNPLLNAGLYASDPRHVARALVA